MKNVKLIVVLLVLLCGLIISTRVTAESNLSKFSVDAINEWTWSTTEVVTTDSPENSYNCDFKVSSEGNVHIAWGENTNYDSSGSDYDIFYKMWEASTGTWITTEVVSTESSDDSHNPSLDIDSSGDVYIVWQDDTDYNGSNADTDIFYKTRSAAGIWSTAEVVSTVSDGTSWDPKLVVNNIGDLYVVWADNTDYDSAETDFDIFWRRKDVSSDTWLNTNVVSDGSTSDSVNPDMATDNSRDVHIVWHDQTNYDSSGTDYDVFYRKMQASIGIWEPMEVVSTESDDLSLYPVIDVHPSTGDIYTAWEDVTEYSTAGSDYDIFFKKRNATLDSWTTTEIVSTEGSSTSEHPDIALDNLGNVHIVWMDPADYQSAGTDIDIFYKIWDKGTNSWNTTSIVFDGSSGASLHPCIQIDSNNQVYIGWEDTTNYLSEGTDRDIFFKRYGETPEAPSLDTITPNPSTDGIITLQWNDVSGALNYSVYRDTSAITSVNSLVPIATVTASQLSDNIDASGEYHYAVVASNLFGDSPISNSPSVQITFPTATTDSTTTTDTTDEATPFPSIFIIVAFTTIVLWRLKKR